MTCEVHLVHYQPQGNVATWVRSRYVYTSLAMMMWQGHAQLLYGFLHQISHCTHRNSSAVHVPFDACDLITCSSLISEKYKPAAQFCSVLSPVDLLPTVDFSVCERQDISTVYLQLPNAQ